MIKSFEHRDYQQRIYKKSIDYLSSDRNGIAHTLLIESPTGSGKTVMSLQICKWLEAEGHEIGWIAHRRELLQQAMNTNDEFFQVNKLNPISMFTRTPEDYEHCTAVVVDECLPGDSLLNVLHEGVPIQASIYDVVNNGIGTHVLSRGDHQPEYNQILNRTPMGKKEIYEIVVQTDDGQFILPITIEGRVYADGEYRRVKDLSVGMNIESLASCCHTYVEHAGQKTIYRDSTIKSSKCPIMPMRLWTESEMVSLHQEVQDLPLQSQPTTTSQDDYLSTGTNHQRDCLGRRKHQLYYEPPNQQTHGESPAPVKTRSDSIAVPALVKNRIGFHNVGQDSDFRESRVRKDHMCIFNVVTSNDLSDRFDGLLPIQNSDQRIFEHTDRFESSSVVDGRRVSKWSIINSLIQSRRTPNHHRLVYRGVQHRSTSEIGQEKKIAVLEYQSTPFEQVARNHQTTYNHIDGIQVGSIVEIRATGQYTETYDIGVDKVHNFYADGILIHNCQHDASASCAILHQVIRPKVIIGLTATPYRTDRAQLSFQKVIRDAGIRQLIREGYLAQFKQWILDQEWSPENVARTYLEDQHEWGKSVIYFLTIAEASACNELLKKNGIRSALITGSSPRSEILRDFSNGAYDVLCNVAVLTEGFDEPTLKTVFVRPGSKGPTVQMAGRALRKHPSTPHVNIVQNNQTKYPFTRHACALNQFMKRDGGWRSIDPRNLKSHFQNQIQKMTQVKIEIPEFLRKENKNVVIVE